MFSNMEMSHEDIYRCSRVDFADRRRVAHTDRERSPCVPVEFRIRQQRLLTASRARERFCSRLNSQDGRLALARRPPVTTRLRAPGNAETIKRCSITELRQLTGSSLGLPLGVLNIAKQAGPGVRVLFRNPPSCGKGRKIKKTPPRGWAEAADRRPP